jgi:hypothetical protein
MKRTLLGIPLGVPPAVLIGVLALAAVVLAPSPAQAAACSGTSGVTVLVQYDDGPTQVGCAKGDPSSGYLALQNAGFDPQRASGSGGGAVCRINGYPRSANCGAMPPADAYWAYFHAQPGGHWVYSTEGADSYDPRPGSVEGWRFKGSASKPPSSAPPKVAAAPSVVPRPTRKPTRKPTAAPTRASASASMPATPSPTAPAATRKASRAPRPVATGTTAPTATPLATASAQAFDEPGPVTAAKDAGSSGGLSWIWGVVLVVVLAGVGGTVALRRRQG